MLLPSRCVYATPRGVCTSEDSGLSVGHDSRREACVQVQATHFNALSRYCGYADPLSFARFLDTQSPAQRQALLDTFYPAWEAETRRGR